jgi:pimeloyl-ACP methyl ester carboxylesterase
MHHAAVGMLALFLLAGSIRAEDTPSAQPPSDRHFFDSAGVKIHYLDRGQGEPVILIHGFGANLDANWTPIIYALAKEYRVIALDNRGHGRSDKPVEQAAYGLNMVEDVARLMDHLEIKQAHIVGYSMGGLITGKFLATHPERVASAVIGGMGWMELDAQWSKFLDDVASNLEAGNGPLPLLKFLSSHMEPQAAENRAQGLNTVFKLTNNQKALAACARQFPQFAITKDTLAANQRPALAVIGENDPFKKNVDDMQKLMGNLQVIIVPGGDHMSTFMSPMFLKEVRTFLQKNRASPVNSAPKAAEKRAA